MGAKRKRTPVPPLQEDTRKETSNDAPLGDREGAPTVPVVGVGASAGGLQAFTELLAGLPDSTGMAFVLVQHLEPSHESNLAEILAHSTSMPVTQVDDGMARPTICT